MMSESGTYDFVCINHEGLETKRIQIHCIYPDDSIQSVKTKLLREFAKYELPSFSYEEIYLFSERATDKHTIPLGKKFTTTHESQFSANPYLVQVDVSGNLFAGNLRNPLLALENMLVLAHEPFTQEIYVCFAKDILDFAEKKKYDPYIFLKLYFPLLILQHNIQNVDDLNQYQQLLMETTNERMANEHTIRVEKTVDLFYNVYRNRTNELPYTQNGITSFTIALLPTETLSLPLEIIFKNLHATVEIPFIKYNPGFKRENIYRLYTENLTKYGEKVPHLEKNVILRLAKQMGRKKTISFYLEGKTISYQGVYDMDMWMEIDIQGNIRIQGHSKKPVTMETLNDQILSKSKRLIQKLNHILLKSGHSLSNFTHLKDTTRVRVISLMNTWSMKIKNDVSLKKLGRCLYPIFEFYGKDKESLALESGIQIRYKRVENYQSMETEDIFIHELYTKTEDIHYVLESFLESFPDKSEEYAKEKIATFFNSLQHHKIKNSPGFPVSMNIQTFNDSVFTLQCEITDHIGYLNTLHVYVDSLLRMTQDPASTSVSMDDIKSLCLKPAKITREEKNAEKESNQMNDAVAGIQTVDYIPVQPLKISSSVDFFSVLEPSVFDLEEESGRQEEEQEDEEKEGEEFDFEIEYEDEEEQQEGGGGGGGGGGKTEDELFLHENDIETLPNLKQYEEFGYEFVGGGEGSQEPEEEMEEYKKQLHGMNLYEGNDNIFLKRLKDRDPILFLDEDITTSKGKFNAYAKKCQANAGRQPVILTQEEKEEIDRKHPGAYRKALEYGSNKDKKHWFICPRYWCLLTNAPMTDDEFKSGVCGKVIENDTVTKGHYVIENKNEKLHMVDGKYVEANPGFLKSGLHPNDLCLPCCFKKTWDSAQLKKRRQECLKSETTTTESNDDLENAKNTEQPFQKNRPVSGYIVGFDKYPVEKDRWGFLPLSVQHLFQIDQSKMLDNSGVLKKGTTTLLRAGTEESITQSFVGCLADVYSSIKGVVVTISEMRKRIVDAIDIDMFIRLHNGSLPVAFKVDHYEMNKINYEKYRYSEFVKKLSFEEAITEDFLSDTIAAYENFQKFMLDPSSVLNHEYLWDAVSIPNPKLFVKGLNLAILYIPEHDITDDVEILCPTAAYSNELYNEKKQTLILILRESIFEPVYLYENRGGNQTPTITKTFKETDGPKTLQFVLQVIRNTSRNYCAPLPSMPKIYKFRRNRPAAQILALLERTRVVAQVLNYQGKVIGIMTQDVYVPTAPSALLNDDDHHHRPIPILYMDDIELWKPYKETRDALQELAAKSKGEILCQPTHKIVEENMIVGILTETNQFVMVNPPIDAAEMDDLVEIRETNYLLADKELASNRTDTEREMASQKIRLETHFYKVFRSTMRLALHQPEHSKQKTALEKILAANDDPSSSSTSTTTQKKEIIRRVNRIVHKLLDKYVDFQIYDDSVLISLDEITTCMNGEGGETESISKQPYCILQNSIHKLVLPKYHLLSKKENANVYYTRLMDEIIRNKRIRKYLLDASIFDIGIPNEYQIHETEMILLQTLMTADYFSAIGPAVAKKTRGKISYEMAMPYKSVPYVNKISLDEQIRMYNQGETRALENTLEVECIKEIGEIKGNQLNLWKKIFPAKTKELFLHNLPTCTFLPILIIYREVYGNDDMTVNELKHKLCVIYRNLSHYIPAILKCWRMQGKRELSDKVRDGKITMEDAVLHNDFYLCNIDYWILCRELKLPVVLFTSMNKIKHLMDGVSWICLYKNTEIGKYWFIRAPTEPDGSSNTAFGYSMLTTSYSLMEIPKFEKMFSEAVLQKSNHVVDLLDHLEKNI